MPAARLWPPTCYTHVVRALKLLFGEGCVQNVEKPLMELTKEYSPHIYRLAVSLTGNAQEAEEVLQQTFLRAYPHLGQFSHQLSARPWLMRIAASEALLRADTGKSEESAQADETTENDEHLTVGEVVDWGAEPEQRYTKAELQQITEQALRALEPPLRNVVVLRDMAKFSIPEITQLLNLSTTSVKGRLLRGRLKLREHLNQYFQEGRNAGSPGGPSVA